MKIEQVLLQKKKVVLKEWFRLILETYPDETAQFLKKEKDPFANPVGSKIWDGIDGLFEELLKEINPLKVSSFLDDIIRVRAVQDFTPSQAVTFIFLFKKVIREELRNELGDKGFLDELFRLESRIDELALIAFDVYSKCREMIFEVRTNEVKNRYFRLLQRANLVHEIPEQESDPGQGTVDNLT